MNTSTTFYADLQALPHGACFFDGDNGYFAVANKRLVYSPAAILAHLSRKSQIKLAVSCANFTANLRDESPKVREALMDEMRMCGITHIEQPLSVKDLVDKILLLEISSCVFKNPEIEAYFLVSGDADMLPAVDFLKRSGKYVCIISSPEVNPHYVRAADEWINIFDLEFPEQGGFYMPPYRRGNVFDIDDLDRPYPARRRSSI